MRKKILIGLVSLAAILTIVLVLIPSRPEKASVRVALPPIIASLPHWIAVDQGYYKDARIEIIHVRLASSGDMMNAIISGDIDFLPAVSLYSAFAFQKDLDVPKAVIFSHSRFQVNPDFEALIVASKSDISKLKDLENKVIGCYPGVTSERFTAHYLASNGVDTSKIDFVRLSPPEHQNALMRDDIQCSHLYEPFLSEMILDGRGRRLTRSVYAYFNEPSAMGSSAISYVLTIKNKDIAHRLLDVWDKAITFIETEPDSSRKILAKELGIAEDVAKKATWVGATKSSETSLDVITNTVNTMIQAGLLDPSAIELVNTLVYFREDN